MTIRWGIIGCGNVTEVKSGPGFQKAAGSALVAVMRRDARLAEDYARRHGVPRWYADADAVIADREVDAVYIATPPGSHEQYALRVCAAGKPCYVEKPMARNHAECERMVAAFAAAGLPLFTAFYRRGLPRFVTARELVASGRLGAIASVSYRYGAPRDERLDPARLPWRLQAEHAGGGLFLDLGSHTLDILDFILGPLEEVDGVAANHASQFAVEDRVALRFRAGAALGTALWNFAAAERRDLIEIAGSAGRLSLSTFGDEPLTLDTPAGVERISRPNPPHVQQPLIQLIADQLHGRGQSPSTGVSGARTQLVMDQALSSYYGGRDDGFWLRSATWPGRRPA
jgi:predicted dehydrogenase